MIPRVIIGDCLDVLADLPAGSVQCCVTSPPYFGLRDYGVPPSSWPAIEFAPMPGLPTVSAPAMSACLGLEPDPWAFVGHLVEVFRRVRRALRDDGVLFLNLGDSYAAQRGGTHQPAETLAGGRNGKAQDGARVNRDRFDGYNPTRNAHSIGLKHKDLIGIPWRVAFALQADGWFLRQDVIWSKPNPMPESVRDRCTKAHEYVFLLAKSERYFWDAAAIAEGMAPSSVERLSQQNLEHQAGSARVPGKTNGNMKAVGGRKAGNKSHKYVDAYDDSESEEHRTKAGLMKVADKVWTTRNRRSVWSIATQPYSGAHYATFPPALVEPCILAGSRPGDTVLDPFGGTGTVGSVAAYHDRRAVLIDINPANEALMGERLEKHEAPLFDGLARPVQEALI